MSSTRIDRIEICDFRGFPGELVPPIKLGGNNLLFLSNPSRWFRSFENQVVGQMLRTRVFGQVSFKPIQPGQ